MANKGIIDRYYNGRPGKPDHQPRDLSNKCGAMVTTVLRERFFSLIGLNILYLIAWLPAIALTVYFAISYSFLVENSSLSSVLITYFAILAPLIMITGPSRMGITLVTRNWARDDHADAVSDFTDGLRKNWKQGFAYSVTYALFFTLSAMAAVFYFPQRGTLTAWVALIIIAAMFIVFELSMQILSVMLVTYEGSFRMHFKNALIITIAELPRAFLTRIVTLIIPIAALVVSIMIPGTAATVLGIVSTLYLLIMVALNHLITNHYANRLCAKYLQPVSK